MTDAFHYRYGAIHPDEGIRFILRHSSGRSERGVTLPAYFLTCILLHHFSASFFFFFPLEAAEMFMKGEELPEVAVTRNGLRKFLTRAFSLNCQF